MKIVADLHLHSKYSRAVSPKMMPDIMAQWAKKKGIDLLGTADWTHPLWLKELETNLKQAGDGIFKVKGEDKVKYFLTTEISSIYSQGGKTRRIHNLMMAPSFNTIHKINEELKRRGCNLLSDGRPIIGLSSIQLAELIWSIDKSVLIVPAHIWTPWFSMFGSKSGFDSIEECWGEFADRIYAVETGLSSDPAMNWRIKELDTRSIVSFGDSHSPPKLGRELTIFELEKLSYDNIYASLCSRTKFDPAFQSQTKKSSRSIAPANRILHTIEFHPEEGKYHYTGHRNCGIKQTPSETKKKGAQCSVCGKPLTLGVMHRVEELANRDQIKPIKKTSKSGVVGYYNSQDETRPPYVMLVPLMEIISEAFNIGVSSQRVQKEYENLIKNLGSELAILTQLKLEEIKKITDERVVEGIKKVRSGQIVIDPGFDGVFGVVKIWPSFAEAAERQDKKAIKSEQETLF